MNPTRSFLLVGLFLASCGGGGGDGGNHGPRDVADTVGADALGWDTAADAPHADPGGTSDPGTTADSAGDDGGLQPLDIPDDLPKGDAGFGEPCSSGAECQSGLCYQSSQAAGCTFSCNADLDCRLDSVPVMLVCQWLGGSVHGCVPPPYTQAVPCTDASPCVFPTICRVDMGECELDPGTCVWDGDCGVGNVCAPIVRKCRPAACQGDPECKDPRLVCRDGACVVPECATDAACGAGKFCQAGSCQDALPCNAEGKCSYQLTCVEDVCMPNRCVTPCSKAGDVCDPITGKCGTACTSPSGCPAEKTCLNGAVCVANGAPYAAARLALGSELLVAADVALGPAVPLDGSQSFDPDGDAIAWRWVLNAAPLGSASEAGKPLGTSATTQFTPDVPGLYAFGLWVTDAAGAVSFQDQAVVQVW